MNSAGGPRLEGKEIVCLATQEWNAHWTPVQQVMARLAPQNRVLYVEPFHAAISRLRNGDAVFQREIRQGVPSLREERPNLFVYRPRYPYFPFHMKLRLSHLLNAPMFSRELRRLLRRLRMREPWLWAFFAQSLSVLGLPFRRTIYDCVDDWPSFFRHPVERSYIERIDRQLTERADIVFVGSRPLLEKKAGQNARMFVVHHAADIPHFRKAADAQTQIPQDLAAIPPPRLGFVGMVDSLRFDSEIIRCLADNPRFQIVMVGGFLGQARQLIPSRPNIHVLGMKPVELLPSYLKGMDVCLMPYQRNETTRYIYPLKLFEYLATGKPVVSTAIPAVAELRDYVRVAESREEFARLVADALASDTEACRRRRMAFAELHSWEAHVAQKEKLILDHLGRD
ncbi:MAG TPA: glycosyltransferase [Terriglobia bacterium]|nr:glycosyltransferase [Terriglobia bacterium]